MAEGGYGEADDLFVIGPAISQHTSPASSVSSLSRSVQDLAGDSLETSEWTIQELTIQLVDGAITRGQGNEVHASPSADINSSESSIEHPVQETQHLPTRSSASSIEHPVEETQHLPARSIASSIEHPVQETQLSPTRSSTSSIEHPVQETQHLPTRSSASSIEHPVEETKHLLAPSSSFCCSLEHRHETDSTVQTRRDASSNEQHIGEASSPIVDAAASQGAEPSATEDSGQLRKIRFIILLPEVADRHSSAPAACCRREELNPSVGEYSCSPEEKQERIRSQGSKPGRSRNTHETSSNSTEAVTVQKLQQPPKPQLQSSNIAAQLAASFNQQENVTVARAATREQLLELPPAKKQQQNVYADRVKRDGMEQAHRARTPPTMQNGATSSGMATAIEAAAAAAIDPSATQSPDCPNTSTLDLVSAAMTDESRDQLLREPPACSNGNSETDLPLAQEDSSAATVSAIDEPDNESQSRPLLQGFGSRASVSQAEAVSWTLRSRSHPNSTAGQSGGQQNISSDNEKPQQQQQQQQQRRSRRLAVRIWLRLLNFCTSCSCLKR